MRYKKLLAVILSSIVVVSVISLVPVFIYGFNVEVLKIEVGIPITGNPAPKSSSETSFVGGYEFNITADSCMISIEKTNMNPYEYLLQQLQGMAECEEDPSFLPIGVEIDLNAMIISPAGQTLSLDFKFTALTGEGIKTAIILIGPDEIKIVNGTYHVEIDATAIVTVAGTELCSIEVTIIADVELLIK